LPSARAGWRARTLVMAPLVEERRRRYTAQDSSCRGAFCPGDDHASRPEYAMTARDSRQHEGRGSQRARWMALAQTGDREAYRALLDDISPELTAYLRRRLANRQEVDDVYQE